MVGHQFERSFRGVGEGGGPAGGSCPTPLLLILEISPVNFIIESVDSICRDGTDTPISLNK